MTLFSKTEVNTGRQMCIDVAKVTTIVFMVAIHTLMYGGCAFDDSVSQFINSVLANPLGAPVFMACMGMGVTFSRNNDALSLAHRGWVLLLVSYIFNFVRAFPALLMGLVWGDSELLGTFVFGFLMVDILQFAGMALLLLALLRWMKASVPAVIMVGVVLSVAGSFVRDFATGLTPIDALLGLFVGINSEPVYSAFPVLNWFIFVGIGLGIGKLIRRCNDMDRLFAWATPMAAALFVALTVWMRKEHLGLYSGVEEDFYYMTTLDALGVCLPAIVLSLGVGHFAGRLLKGKAAEQVYRTASDLVRIYLVHWIFVIWLISGIVVEILGIKLSTEVLLLIAMAILILSVWMARQKPFSRIKL